MLILEAIFDNNIINATFGAKVCAETLGLRKVDHKYLEDFEMCCWTRM